MKQQTAVELFAIALYEGGYLQGNGDEIQNLLEQAKEMQKEQIVNAYTSNSMIRTNSKAEQYYNETYGGNK